MADTVKIPVVDLKGKEVSSFAGASELFTAVPNEKVVHFVSNGERFRYYTKTACTKTRSAVSGGGRKIFKQKGTGNARHGGKRAPIFVGGGVAFGPKPIKRDFKINKKVSKSALASVLSDRYSSGQIKVLKDGLLSEPKTKSVNELLKALPLSGARVGFVVTDEADGALARSVRNIKGTDLLTPELWSTLHFVKADALIFSEKAIERLNSQYIGKGA